MYKKTRYNAVQADNCNVIFRIYKGFSLAELMIVMLILTIILAATMPILSKRAKVKAAATGGGGSSLWQKISASSDDIYYGASPANNNRVAIGTNTFGSTDARLVLNTSGNSQKHIVFKQAGSEIGNLNVVSQGDIVLGNNSNPVGGVAIGSYVNNRAAADADGDTGYGTDNIVIGWTAMTNQHSGYEPSKDTIIGARAETLAHGSIAIGHHAFAGGGHDGTNQWAGATAIGGGAKGQGSVALGSAYNYYDYSISIGDNVFVGDTTDSTGSIAIGAADIYDTSGGRSSPVINGQYSIAIGSNTAITMNYSTAIGYRAKCNGSSTQNALAIGREAVATANNSSAIGYKASNSTANTIVLGSSSNTKINYYGTLTNLSDIRLKKLNGDFNDGLDKLRKLHPYNYIWKSDKIKSPHVGVVAQDLQKIFPGSVSKNSDGYLTIEKDYIFYCMLNSIKELDKMVQGIINDVKSLSLRIQKVEEKMVALLKSTELENKRIKQLETENKQLKNKNAEFEKRLRKLEKTLK